MTVNKEMTNAICSICLQEVDTYIYKGTIMKENHNYRDSELQCPGSAESIWETD